MLLLTPGPSGSRDVPGDPTPPLITPLIFGTLGANGWYVSNVTVNWRVEDPESAILWSSGCDARTLTADTVGTRLTCSAASDGGETTVTITIRRDTTPPTVGADPARPADFNGWYNHALTVAFSGTDATSGIDVCSGAQSYSGPDRADASVAGSCRDRAGNTTPRSFGFQYDATAPQVTGASPSRPRDANGWYNHALSVAFSGTDATSGIDACSQAGYGGPDSASASVSGTCRDLAGNQSGSSSFILQYDETAPAAGAAPSRAPDANGWYNHALTVAFSGTDPTSGIDVCTAPQTYSGPDRADASVTGSCRDRAGNTTPRSFGFQYDATGPVVTATPSRNADANGWYNHALTVAFAGTDPMSGMDVCSGPQGYSGPDRADASVSGSCRDRAGNTTPRSFGFQYDATVPQVTGASAARLPDANGWYNHALTVAFAGADPTSGIDACSQASYAGPDSASASVRGTCRDRAGNESGQSAFALQYDATGPHVTATPSRSADANGWYNHALAVAFSGADPISGIDVCSGPQGYSGPDRGDASVSGSCRDRAGNTTPRSFGFQYDATGPLVTATPSRSADANGWYNHTLTVGFTGTDGTSGIDVCSAAQGYSGPDRADASVSGSCRDRAGNTTPRSFGFQYDDTGPQVTATPSRAADANGWYNHALTVAFAGTDPISGVDVCSGPQGYSGPDRADASVSGSCRDRAGNTTPRSLAVNYDETAPQVTGASPARPPDANGWHNHPVTINFQGSDATSGIGGCTAVSYAGPDNGAASVSGSCRDRAGNQSGSSTSALRYDATSPEVTTAIPTRPPDREGWYRRAVVFAFGGSDETSGIDECSPTTYEGPDARNAAVAGSCLDEAGNRGVRSFPLSYDATGPQVIAEAERGPDANDWYNHPLLVTFTGRDTASGFDSCSPPQRYEGPDTTFAAVGGSCLDKAGNIGLGSLLLKYDTTPPQVTGASPARDPDANGWYNHTLTISFLAGDATSGVDSCTEARYAGPDNAHASVSGSCRDRAGNGSAAASFALRYDSTPPSLTDVRVKTGNRTALLSWRASPDTSRIEVVRSVGSQGAGVTVYRGAGQSFTDTRLANGTRYHYAVTGYDEAHNSATRGVQARPMAPLFAPAAGARVSAPPRLSWAPVQRAAYYNVQLWRGGKILSAWPARSSLRLKRNWTYAGRRYQLTPGRYRWYVWPGYGRPAARNYGRLLGSSSFVVIR